MSKLYMELDAAIDRIITLSQWYGNLSKYGEYAEDREWLRNELEQVCDLPCDVGPLPKWNTDKPKESGWYLVTYTDKDGLNAPFVNSAYYSAFSESWDDLKSWIRIVGWMPFPKPMKIRDEDEED